MLMILYLGIEIDYCMGEYGIFNLIFKIMAYMIVYGTFMYIFFLNVGKEYYRNEFHYVTSDTGIMFYGNDYFLTVRQYSR